MDIVANAADFTRQYKMRLGKAVDIVLWKRVQNNWKKKTHLKCKLNEHYKKNWETLIFDIICLFLHSVGTYYENSYFIRSYLCINLMKHKSRPIVVQLSGTGHTTE